MTSNFAFQNPIKRLEEISSSPKELRDPDCVNEYLKKEEYITVLEVSGNKKVYSITESGKKILEELK